MRRITDFIVDKRYFILILFVILTIVSAIFSNKVKLNYDIAEYLPDTSETRKGMDIMEEEFAGTETSTLNLMFESLADDKKLDIKADLEKIKGVKSVDYDDSEDYNKDKYTLYVITVDDESDSKLAKDVYNNVIEKYDENYTIYTSGNVSDTNKTVLPIGIIVLAVGCALVILIIMCESYIEPFLFLTAILMAVVLNKGTNIIFGTISNITSSIAAILQLALSMDYSIMLMNRYTQEKENEKDKVKAMKNALYHAFQAISSSSVTTIVGLLALVFMSFTIGKDLGFVLAKGVLFSLICIFFVLPALILMFDKLITKTKKKTPNIKLDWLGKLSYKMRFIAVPLFLVVLVGSFILKGNLGFDYTQTQADEVSDVFEETNQMVVLYKNDDEEKIRSYLNKIEEEKKVDEVLAYGNTIGEKLPYDKLNERFNDLDSDVTIEDYLLKIIYYDYFNPEITSTYDFNEFVQFVENDVYNTPKMNEQIDEETRNNITRLKNFITDEEINKLRQPSEIATILEVDQDKLNDILVLYLSQNSNTQISINDFIDFMNNSVLKDQKYSSKIDKSAISNLNTLSKFANKELAQTKMTSNQIAELFGMDANIVGELFKYYVNINEIDTKLTIQEFSNFVINNVLQNPSYANSFDETAIQNIKMMNVFSNSSIITTKMNSKNLSELFGISETQISQIMMISGVNELTPQEFVNTILNNDMIKATLDENTLAKLNLLSNIMLSSLNDVKYSYQELSQFTGIDTTSLKNIYTLYVVSLNNTQITPLEFISFILEHKNDEALNGKISQETLTKLNLVQTVMNGAIANKQYTYSELSNLLGINQEDLKLLYGLYTFKYLNPNPQMSMRDFVTFLLNDVITNPNYSNGFEQDKITKLNTVNTIMNNALNGVKYTSSEMFDIASKLTNNIEKKTLDILYIYKGSISSYNENWTLTVEEFVNFLNDNVLQDERFTDFIEDDMRNDVVNAKEDIKDAKELLIGNNYSRILINTKFASENDETFKFIQNVKDLLKDLDNSYILGDSPMAYEMSKTFNNELNFITVITMAFIFIVVAITFKSVLLPIILVLTIQCAVFLIMGILSFVGENVYFIAILIVQSILMGATIDYAILYTSYYLEHRKTLGVKESVIASYNSSIHTILTSSSILIIVTLIIANFASAIAAKICKTVSQGTLCSTLLILFLIPSVLAMCDKIIVRHKKEKTGE